MKAFAFEPSRTPFGSVFSFLRVAAADDDIVGFESGFQSCHDVGDVPAPFLLAEMLECRLADGFFIGASLPIGKVRQFHWFQHASRR